MGLHASFSHLILGFCLASLQNAVEIEGEVAEVDGQTFTVSSASELLPAVGDKLSVFVEIPDVGKASVAAATVSSIEDEVIVARIDEATGTVRRGQLVAIRALKPTRRTKPGGGTTDWGRPLDPDGDCTIRETGDRVTIEIPAGNHDLWFGGEGRFNAPRMLQDVAGDFVVQVKVTADLRAGVQRPAFHFHGCGLVVWDSPRQYLRLERNYLYNDNYGEICYATPLYDRNQKRINGWKMVDASFFSNRSTWLRIERSGTTITTSISHDGEQWMTTAVLATEFPDRVQVGIHAAAISSRQLTADFEEFSITRPSPEQSAAAVDSLPMAGWGDAYDADQACAMVATPKRLRINVPAGVYDLWYAREDKSASQNAPRVLRDVEGDFVVQVKVTADCLGPTVETGGMARCAGLVLYESPDHYLRVERNRYIPEADTRNASWYPPLYDRDGQRLTEWKATLNELFAGESTWLRIERSGQNIISSISRDGRSWTNRTTTATSLPRKLRVGVLAINNSSGEFVANFEDFQLTQR